MFRFRRQSEHEFPPNVRFRRAKRFGLRGLLVALFFERHRKRGEVVECPPGERARKTLQMLS